MQALERLVRLWRGLWRPWSLCDDGWPIAESGAGEEAAANAALLANDWVRAEARSRASEARARKLLCRTLSASQLQELQTHGCFAVEASGRGRFYILPRTTLNVFHPQTGDLYCCSTEILVPLSDLMLAQKLVLENDPDRFFAVANRRPKQFAGPWEQELRRALDCDEERLGRQ